MAHPRRIARVAKQIEREVGTLLLTDRALREAVCPERRRGLDSAVSALASVTEVVISNDLQVAKVYISVFSDEAGKDTAMAGLTRLEGYVRKQIGRLIRLRLTPEIRFLRDDSFERGERVVALLDRIKKQEQGLVEPPPLTLPSGLEGEDDADLEARYAGWMGAEGELDPDSDEAMELVDELDDADEGFFGGAGGDGDGPGDSMAEAMGAAAAAAILPPRPAASGRAVAGRQRRKGGSSASRGSSRKAAR